jgi:hypothetical protein
MAKQLVCQVYDKLFKEIQIPISLGWKNDPPNQDLVGNSSSEEIRSCLDVLSPTNLNCDYPSHNTVLTLANPVTNRIFNRVRRVPVTRNKDFLW